MYLTGSRVDSRFHLPNCGLPYVHRLPIRKPERRKLRGLRELLEISYVDFAMGGVGFS